MTRRMFGCVWTIAISAIVGLSFFSFEEAFGSVPGCAGAFQGSFEEASSRPDWLQSVTPELLLRNSGQRDAPEALALRREELQDLEAYLSHPDLMRRPEELEVLARAGAPSDRRRQQSLRVLANSEMAFRLLARQEPGLAVELAIRWLKAFTPLERTQSSEMRDLETDLYLLGTRLMRIGLESSRPEQLGPFIQAFAMSLMQRKLMVLEPYLGVQYKSLLARLADLPSEFHPQSIEEKRMLTRPSNIFVIHFQKATQDRQGEPLDGPKIAQNFYREIAPYLERLGNPAAAKAYRSRARSLASARHQKVEDQERARQGLQEDPPFLKEVREGWTPEKDRADHPEMERPEFEKDPLAEEPDREFTLEPEKPFEPDSFLRSTKDSPSEESTPGRVRRMKPSLPVSEVWVTTGDLLAQTPVVLTRSAEKRSAAVGDQDIRELIAYLRHPSLHFEPALAQEGLEREFASVARKDPRIAQATQVFALLIRSVDLLRASDRQRGTEHALEEGLRLLSQSDPLSRAQQVDRARAFAHELHEAVLKAVLESRQEGAISGYFRAVGESLAPEVWTKLSGHEAKQIRILLVRAERLPLRSRPSISEIARWIQAVETHSDRSLREVQDLLDQARAYQPYPQPTAE